MFLLRSNGSIIVTVMNSLYVAVPGRYKGSNEKWISKNICAVSAEWGVVENCVASNFIYSSTLIPTPFLYWLLNVRSGSSSQRCDIMVSEIIIASVREIFFLLLQQHPVLTKLTAPSQRMWTVPLPSNRAQPLSYQHWSVSKRCTAFYTAILIRFS